MTTQITPAQKRTNGMIRTTICGIPCFIQVNACVVTPGNIFADNDVDYYGDVDVDFTVFDRKGYRAEWLSRKLTCEEGVRITNLIIQSRASRL